MASVLLKLSLDQPVVKYVLSSTPADQWLALIKWLSNSNIGLCTQQEYDNPDKLVAGNLYCVRGGEVEESYVIFQVLVTTEWDDKDNPAPQFTNNLSWLVWTVIPLPTIPTL